MVAIVLVKIISVDDYHQQKKSFIITIVMFYHKTYFNTIEKYY